MIRDTARAARAAVVCLVAGCAGDPAAPAAPPLTLADVAGTYVLTSFGGAAPPVDVGGERLLADTVRIAADGRGRRTLYLVDATTGRPFPGDEVGWSSSPVTLVPARDSLWVVWWQDPGLRFNYAQSYRVLDRGARLAGQVMGDPWYAARASEYRRVP